MYHLDTTEIPPRYGNHYPKWQPLPALASPHSHRGVRGLINQRCIHMYIQPYAHRYIHTMTIGGRGCGWAGLYHIHIYISIFIYLHIYVYIYIISACKMGYKSIWCRLLRISLESAACRLHVVFRSFLRRSCCGTSMSLRSAGGQKEVLTMNHWLSTIGNHY